MLIETVKNFYFHRFMNVVMKDVTVQGNDDQLYNFNKFFVRARNIRYVQIPDDVRWSILSRNFLVFDRGFT